MSATASWLFFDSDKHTTSTISFSERHALDEWQFSILIRKKFQVKILNVHDFDKT